LTYNVVEAPGGKVVVVGGGGIDGGEAWRLTAPSGDSPSIMQAFETTGAPLSFWMTSIAGRRSPLMTLGADSSTAV
jgi:hypothetical protein